MSENDEMRMVSDKEKILEKTEGTRGIKTISVKFNTCEGDEIEIIRRTPSDKIGFLQVNNMIKDLGVELQMNVVRKGAGG